MTLLEDAGNSFRQAACRLLAEKINSVLNVAVYKLLANLFQKYYRNIYKLHLPFNAAE